MGQTIVVLGGGVGGLVAARRLRGLLQPEHRVVLVDRVGRHVFWPSLLWVMTGQREPSAITRDLSRLERKGIEVRTGAVTALDPARRAVTVDGTEIVADHVVIALGADLALDAVPGFTPDAAHHFYDPEGAACLRDALRRFAGGRVAIVIAGLPYRCPAAPWEAAFLLNAHLAARGVPAVISVYTPETGPLPVMGAAVSAGVGELLRAQGIAYHPAHQLREVRAASSQLAFADGATAGYDLLVVVPPVRPPAALRGAGLLDASGWVPVDRETLATAHPGVYAIGDATTVTLPGGGVLPKAGVFAHGQAETVAANIAAEVRGRKRRERFDGYGACFLEVGNGRAGFGSGEFFAEPQPRARLRPPARRWHWSKVWWEKNWMWKWF